MFILANVGCTVRIIKSVMKTGITLFGKYFTQKKSRPLTFKIRKLADNNV
jgi:hypothetical protein